MRRFRSSLLILLALWLPLQAAAAWAMPLCRHAAAHQAQEQALAAADHCHHGQAATTATPVAAADLDCDNCEICHLASAGYLLAAAEAVPALPAHSVMVPRPASTLPSHIGEPPQQPPRRLN